MTPGLVGSLPAYSAKQRSYQMNNNTKCLLIVAVSPFIVGTLLTVKFVGFLGRSVWNVLNTKNDNA